MRRAADCNDDPLVGPAGSVVRLDEVLEINAIMRQKGPLVLGCELELVGIVTSQHSRFDCRERFKSPRPQQRRHKHVDIFVKIELYEQPTRGSSDLGSILLSGIRFRSM